MKPRLATTFVLLMLTPVAANTNLQKELRSLYPIDQSTASQSAAVKQAVRASFGPAVEAETLFNPYYLIGDFNGDGGQDIVIAVRIKGRRTALPKGVTLLNPFSGKVIYPTNPVAKPALALAIIHGGLTGWQAVPSAGDFLLYGDAPVQILTYDDHIIYYGEGGVQKTQDRETAKTMAKGLMELRKRGKRRRDEWLPRAANKGDVIILGSEVGDSYLYWNGKTYVWEDSPQD